MADTAEDQASKPSGDRKRGAAGRDGSTLIKPRYVDNGWPTTDPDDHAVSELVTDRTGALSPFGEVTFPVSAEELPYIHPVTVVNR